MNYSSINLTRYVENLHVENYKTPMEAIEAVNTWRDTPCSWAGRLNSTDVSLLPNSVYRLNTKAIEIPASSFV